ncbi:hydrogenase maturation protease [Amphritea pacifica]|uniref:hydrogenase maturation protease n=1 Tax=Amphritea pacifica TaxID=2811233 RepID=UPI0019646286|nr:hydrogenase maturation protease [Amphritea pacifica]MBN1005171.1 hydrogenase maturation protease [Amphritea pacifica]
MHSAVEPARLSLADLSHDDCLIYGIGNVGRQDDGLGWAFVDWLEVAGLCVDAERVRNYQLFLEDADLISSKQKVLFIDATRSPEVSTFSLYRARAELDFSFTSHAISIPSIIATCQLCFERQPEVYVLAIRGYEWELQEGLTIAAKSNLDAAIAHFSAELTETHSGPATRKG